MSAQKKTLETATLEERLAQVRASHGDKVSVDALGEIVGALMAGEVITVGDEHDTVVAQLAEMLEEISRAKDELLEIRPRDTSARAIPNATTELDAVVDATAAAADQIMDAAEKIDDVAGKVDGELADALATVSTQLYEASSFQDITGQRINKVTTTLNELEARLSALAEAIGDNQIFDDEPEIEINEEGLVEDDRAILHGPQLEEKANTQEDIDAILASFD